VGEGFAGKEITGSIRQVRRIARIFLIVCLIASVFIVVRITQNLEGNPLIVGAPAVAGLGAVFYAAYYRILMHQEGRIVCLLTQEMNPGLFAEVVRQTRSKEKAFAMTNLMMDVTARFYLGDYAAVLQAVRGQRRFWSWSQPEFMSYYVQSACALGDRERAEEGLRVLIQVRYKKEYANPTVKRHCESYLSLAEAPYRLITGDWERAELLARGVYEDGGYGELRELYACAYLARALEGQGKTPEARSLTERLKTYHPSFGILRDLFGEPSVQGDGTDRIRSQKHRAGRRKA